MIALQKYFDNVTKEIEIMREKVQDAKAIKADLIGLSLSKEYMSDEKLAETEQKLDRKRKKLADLENKYAQAKKVKADMAEGEGDEKYMTDDEISATMEKIENVQQVLKTMNKTDIPVQAQENNDKANKELECVVCLDIPFGTVFSCTEHHILCLACKFKVTSKCPICAQDFEDIPPTRNRLAERIIATLT